MPADPHGRRLPGRWDPGAGIYYLERGVSHIKWLDLIRRTAAFSSFVGVHTPGARGLNVLVRVSQFTQSAANPAIVLIVYGLDPIGGGTQYAQLTTPAGGVAGAIAATGIYRFPLYPNATASGHTRDVLNPFWKLSLSYTNVAEATFSVVTELLP